MEKEIIQERFLNTLRLNVIFCHFGPNNSDTQNLMKKNNIGHYFTYENKNLKEKILDLFNESSKVNTSR